MNKCQRADTVRPDCCEEGMAVRARLAGYPMRYTMLPSELFKSSTMTPLQQQVAETGRCPFCRTKRLKYLHTGSDMDFHQCLDCLKVFVLPEVPKLIG